MVIVTGRQPDILATTTQALAERGLVTHVVSSMDLEGDEALFDAAWDHRPTHVIAIGSPSQRQRDGDPTLVAAALRAARSRAHPILVWVTFAEADDDPTSEQIQRNGAPYVILRAGRFVRSGDLEPEPIPGREVLVAPGLPVPTEGLSTPASLAADIARVLDDENMMGRTVRASFRGEGAWISVVDSFGGKPRPVSRTRAMWSRWLGGPVLRLSGAGDERDAGTETTPNLPTWIWGADLGGLAWPAPVVQQPGGMERDS